MKLPLVISVPHAGTVVPPEVRDICLLTPEDIIEDGDRGALDIYGPLEDEAVAFKAASVARAVVDLNRPEEDRGADGVVKTHTIWLKPVYDRKLPEKTARLLVERYWRPYHEALTGLAGSGAAMGLDCHTMVEIAPPIAPEPGTPRPKVCISNAFGTCPDEWLKGLGRAFESAFGAEVGINAPFKGGYIIRSHAKELPWAQIELSRGGFMSDEEKRRRVLDAIRSWSEETF